MTDRYDIFIKDSNENPIKRLKRHDDIEPWIKRNANEKLHYVVKHQKNGHYEQVTPASNGLSDRSMGASSFKVTSRKLKLINDVMEQWSHVSCLCHHGWGRFDYSCIKDYMSATSGNPSYHHDYDDEGNNITKTRHEKTLEGSFGKLFR